MKAALEEILQVDGANVPSPIITIIIIITSKSCTPRDLYLANIAFDWVTITMLQTLLTSRHRQTQHLSKL